MVAQTWIGASTIARDWQTVGDDMRQSFRETADRHGIDVGSLCVEQDTGPLPPPEWFHRLEERLPGAGVEAIKGLREVGERRRQTERRAGLIRWLLSKVSLFCWLRRSS